MREARNDTLNERLRGHPGVFGRVHVLEVRIFAARNRGNRGRCSSNGAYSDLLGSPGPE